MTSTLVTDPGALESFIERHTRDGGPGSNELQEAVAEALFRLAVHPDTPGERAVSALQRAVRFDGNNPKLAYHLARVLFVHGKLDEAAHWFSRAVSLSPTSHRIWSHICLLQRELNQRYKGDDRYEADELKDKSFEIARRVAEGRDGMEPGLLVFEPSRSRASIEEEARQHKAPGDHRAGQEEPAVAEESGAEPPFREVPRAQRPHTCRWAGIHAIDAMTTLEASPSAYARVQLLTELRQLALRAVTNPAGITPFCITAIMALARGYPAALVRELWDRMLVLAEHPVASLLLTTLELREADEERLPALLDDALGAGTIPPVLAALLHERRLGWRPVLLQGSSHYRDARRLLRECRRLRSGEQDEALVERIELQLQALEGFSAGLEPKRPAALPAYQPDRKALRIGAEESFTLILEMDQRCDSMQSIGMSLVALLRLYHAWLATQEDRQEELARKVLRQAKGARDDLAAEIRASREELDLVLEAFCFGPSGYIDSLLAERWLSCHGRLVRLSWAEEIEPAFAELSALVGGESDSKLAEPESAEAVRTKAVEASERLLSQLWPTKLGHMDFIGKVRTTFAEDLESACEGEVDLEQVAVSRMALAQLLLELDSLRVRWKEARDLVLLVARAANPRRSGSETGVHEWAAPELKLAEVDSAIAAIVDAWPSGQLDEPWGTLRRWSQALRSGDEGADQAAMLALQVRRQLLERSLQQHWAQLGAFESPAAFEAADAEAQRSLRENSAATERQLQDLLEDFEAARDAQPSSGAEEETLLQWLEGECGTLKRWRGTRHERLHWLLGTEPDADGAPPISPAPREGFRALLAELEPCLRELDFLESFARLVLRSLAPAPTQAADLEATTDDALDEEADTDPGDAPTDPGLEEEPPPPAPQLPLEQQFAGALVPLDRLQARIRDLASEGEQDFGNLGEQFEAIEEIAKSLKKIQEITATTFNTDVAQRCSAIQAGSEAPQALREELEVFQLLGEALEAVSKLGRKTLAAVVEAIEDAPQEMLPEQFSARRESTKSTLLASILSAPVRRNIARLCKKWSCGASLDEPEEAPAEWLARLQQVRDDREKLEVLLSNLASEPAQAQAASSEGEQDSTGPAPSEAVDPPPPPEPPQESSAVEQLAWQLALVDRRIDALLDETRATFAAYSPSNLATPAMTVLERRFRHREALSRYRLGQRVRARGIWNQLSLEDPLDLEACVNLAVCETVSGDRSLAMQEWRSYAELLYLMDVLRGSLRHGAERRAALHHALGHSVAPHAITARLDNEWKDLADPAALAEFLDSGARLAHFVDHVYAWLLNAKLDFHSASLLLGIRRTERVEVARGARDKLLTFAAAACELLPEKVRASVSDLCRHEIEQAFLACEGSEGLTLRQEPHYEEEEPRRTQWLVDAFHLKFKLFALIGGNDALFARLRSLDFLPQLARIDAIPVDLSKTLLTPIAAALDSRNTLRTIENANNLAETTLQSFLLFVFGEPTPEADAEQRFAQYRALVSSWVRRPALAEHLELIDNPQFCLPTAVTGVFPFLKSEARWNEREQKAVDGAIRELTAWCERYPEISGAASLLANILVRRGGTARVQQAIEVLNRAARSGFRAEGRDDCAKMARGLRLRPISELIEEKSYDEALRQLRCVIQEGQVDKDVAILLQNAYNGWLEADRSRAHAIYDGIVEDFPPVLQALEGELLDKLRKAWQVLLFQAAILPMTPIDEKRWPEVERWMGKVLSVDPDNLQAVHMRMVALAQMAQALMAQARAGARNARELQQQAIALLDKADPLARRVKRESSDPEQKKTAAAILNRNG